jgi:hypothetical protein
MSGGVVQLVATGAQDTWLTGKPEISFYRSSYRRYTHYASSVERQIIQGQPSAGGISTIRFEKKGDLINYTYFTARDSNGTLINNIDWSKVIDKIELMIGGQVIDTHDFEYMSDIEPVTGAQTFSNRYLNVSPSGPTNQKNGFFPLKFFFCKDWSVSLPLVALQYHDVELRITWSANLNQTVNFGTTTGASLGVPQATASCVSSGVATALGSNTANLVFTQSAGPLFPGMLVTSAVNNVAANSVIVQSFSNNSANIIVAFANTTNTNVISATYAGATMNIFTPVLTSVGPTAATTIAAGATSSAITFNGFANPLGGAGLPALGQFVAIPNVGQGYVSSVSNVANNNVTVTFFNSAPQTTVAGPISFFNGAETSATTYAGLQFQAWSNFVYLDQTERDYFAKTPQDLLISQVTRVSALNTPVQELALAHPIKFIAFPAVSYAQIWANGAGSATALNYQLKTQINGVDVGEFKFLPQWVDIPQYYNTPFGYVHNNQAANVAIISYCLDTSKLQPTGTLNFSRLDTFRLITPPQLTNGVLGMASAPINYPATYLYAVNYNVLRIQNGLGGLLYAN